MQCVSHVGVEGGWISDVLSHELADGEVEPLAFQFKCAATDIGSARVVARRRLGQLIG